MEGAKVWFLVKELDFLHAATEDGRSCVPQDPV